MVFKEKDFVEIDFDIYANDKLVQTTNEKLGKENKLDIKEYKPQEMIVGSGFILKALDDTLIKDGKEKGFLELETEQAYGKRKKEFIKTFPKSSFDEHKLRPVVGITYDFNGTYGTVKSVAGGRIMVDFNNPLAGKDIKLNYSINKKITDVKTKLRIVLESILRMTPEMFDIVVKEKEITFFVPEQVIPIKDQLIKTLEEYIPEIKEYKVKFDILKIKS